LSVIAQLIGVSPALYSLAGEFSQFGLKVSLLNQSLKVSLFFFVDLSLPILLFSSLEHKLLVAIF
jgi:hypothetical protein